MVYSLTYRRPAHVVSSRASVVSEKPSVATSTSANSLFSGPGIPQALSFDRIIEGGTCPPCTTRDFMNYLVYIEHAAENLQFFLWYRDYTKRFMALPEAQRSLAPGIDSEKFDADPGRGARSPKTPMSATTAEVFKGTDFAVSKTNVTDQPQNPFFDPPTPPNADGRPSTSGSKGWEDDTMTLQSGKKADHHAIAAKAYASADIKVQPFTVQPFREEITRIIAIYIADDSPRQLNLAAKERTELLQALASTTNPGAFQSVLRTIEWTLRHQAHPNFIRWTICNGNRPRVIFARGLGIGGIVGGIITAVLLTISGASRQWRIISAIPFIIGIATLFAAWKGMCVVLHGMHHRHLRPWELFVDEDEVSSDRLKYDSVDSFTSNKSYEDEPWIAKYEKRNVIRKVFDREVWIQEPALRQIQDTIFLQALLAAALVTAATVGVFCAIPKGNKF